MSEFVGRGEQRAIDILKNLLPNYQIKPQVPIQELLPTNLLNEFVKLGSDYTRHPHDIVLHHLDLGYIIIEVNYEHGPIAEAKWKVYKSYLEKAGHRTVTIDDNECMSLFQLKDGIHTNSWQDYIDVIRALHRAGIEA